MTPIEEEALVRTFDYLKPTSTEEALAMLAQYGDRAKVIAG